MVERDLAKVEVAGSSPVIRSKRSTSKEVLFYFKIRKDCHYAQIKRCGFEARGQKAQGPCGRISQNHSHHDGFPVSWRLIRYFNEDLGLQLFLSLGHESDDLWRIAGIRGGVDAAWKLCAAPDADHDLAHSARHLFYGVAMLDKYKGTGWKKLYLIFGMCDESFSVNCSTEIPEEVDKGWFVFFVTLLNQTYWVVGATAGGLLGSLVQFDATGLDFVMTAMFVVIFLENWLKEKKHYTSLIGVCASALCLVILGPDSFMIPTMITILCFLSLLKKPIEKGGAENDGHGTDSDDCHLRSRHDGDSLSSLYYIFVQTSRSEICSVSRKGSARCCFWNAGGLLSEKRQSDRPPLWSSGADRHCFRGALHLWKRQMLLSIAGETAVYMLLVQAVF